MRCFVLSIGVTLAAGALAGASVAGVAPGRQIHVDCSAAERGDGSRQSPISDLRRASRIPLRPGTRLVLRRGTSCAGELAPLGSGSQRRPAVIGAYGKGPRPRIDARGEQPILLKNTSWVRLQDLELTARGDFGSRRRGVHVLAKEETVRGVTIRRLRIHDVQGNLVKDSYGSGGIQLTADGTPGVARFGRIVIARNRIADVSRSGIFIVGATDPNRPRATEPWPEAARRVVVRRNRIDGIAGDGIVSLGTDGALVERNVVSRGNRAGRGPNHPDGLLCNAGIWAFHANNTLIQHNEVFDFEFRGCDGTGYDIDYDQDATTVQYNLSHGNEGGFMLLCLDTRPRTAEIRFNLSVDDRHTFQQSACEGRAGLSGTLSGIRVYNNTWVLPRQRTKNALGLPLPALGIPGTFEFRNNILVSTKGQRAPFACGQQCSHNLFRGLPPSGTNAVTGRPRFADPGRRGRGLLKLATGFRLRPDSAAIGAGTATARSPARDYFGTRVPNPPAIGFAQP